MVDCRVCGYAMNGDNRLGAILCTLYLLPPLSDEAKITERKGIMSWTTTSSSIGLD